MQFVYLKECGQAGLLSPFLLSENMKISTLCLSYFFIYFLMKKFIWLTFLIFFINIFLIDLSNANWKEYTYKSSRNEDNKYIMLNNWNEITSKYSPVNDNFWEIYIKNWNEVVLLVLIKDKKFFESNEYKSIVRNSLDFSPTWNSFIFQAIKNNWNKVLVKDWIESNEYSEISSPIFSKNWKDFVFLAIKDWKQILIKNWTEINNYDYVENPEFSSDSKTFSFTAEKDWKEVLVTNWVETDKRIFNIPMCKEEVLKTTKTFRLDWKSITNFGSKVILESDKNKYKNFWNIQLSPNWKNIIYTAQKNNWKWIIVNNWIESSEYNSINDVKFSSDSKNIAFISEKENWKKVVVKNWVEWNEYGGWNDYIWIDSLMFSPDWKSLFYRIYKNNKQIIVKDWIESQEYDYIDFEYPHTIQFDSNGNYYLFATKGRNNVLVKNWTEIYTWASYPIFSQNWNNYIFSFYKNWKTVFVKNWVELNKYDDWKDYIWIDSLTLSQDWKSFSYVVSEIDSSEKKWNRFVIKDWVKWKWYTWIKSLTYSPDWKTFVYLWFKENEWRWVIIKNWIEIDHKNYWIADRFKFSPDSKNLFYEIQRNWESFLYKNWIQIDKSSIDSLIFSNDWKNYAYLKKWNNRSMIIKDWKEMNCDSYSCSNPIFSPDSKDLYYIWYDNENWWNILFKNWNQIKKYKSISTDSFIFSLKWNLTFSALNNNYKNILVKDWTESDVFDLLIDKKYSSDWNTFITKLFKWWRVYLVKETCSVDNMYIPKKEESKLDKNTLQLIDNLANKINNYSILDKEKIKSKLNTLINKYSEWSKNYEIIKYISEKIQ